MLNRLGGAAAFAAVAFSTMTACSSDDDGGDAAAGGGGAASDGGSGGDATGGDAGSGGDATGGNGGSSGVGSGGSGGDDPMAACIAAQPSSLGEACATCRCETCGDEMAACQADSACAAISVCTNETGCFGTDCYQPTTCMDVFDANGGPFSSSVDLLIAAGNCIDACASDCGGVAAGDPIPATITVTDGTDPIADAEICIKDTTDCATSDADGVVNLDVPALSEVAMTVVATDYTTVLLGTVSGPSSVEVTVTMSSTTDTEAAAAAAGITLDDTKGAIGFSLFGPGGATVSLSPDSGTLVYTDANGDPDPSLTSSVEGISPTAIFWNVDPGDYDLSFSHTDTSCAAGAVGTWTGSTAGTTRVTVVAGAFSSGGHWGQCDPIP